MRCSDSAATTPRSAQICPARFAVWHTPDMPDPNPFDRLARYYDWEHDDYDADIPLYLDFARRTGGPILEVACGTGRLMVPLLEQGQRVVGIDSSGPMLERARQVIGRAGLETERRSTRPTFARFDLRERFRLAIFGLDSFGLLPTDRRPDRRAGPHPRHLEPDGLLVMDLSNGNGRGAEPTRRAGPPARRLRSGDRPAAQQVDGPRHRPRRAGRSLHLLL